MFDYNFYGYGNGISHIYPFNGTQTTISIILIIVSVIGLWATFQKADVAGWWSLIPIARNIKLYKIAGLNPWLVILNVLGNILWVFSIPVGFSGKESIAAVMLISGIALLIIYIVSYIVAMVKLAKAFSYPGAFAVGLILLNAIFICIVGFSSHQYEGKKYTRT